jgi:hypothetical protein
LDGRACGAQHRNFAQHNDPARRSEVFKTAFRKAHPVSISAAMDFAREPELEMRIRQALLPRAAAGETVTYEALAREIGVQPPHRIHRLTLALEAMTRDDVAFGRPPLAALAVSKGEGGVPGRGYFQLLRELGLHDGPDRGEAARARHAVLLGEVAAYWGKS